MPEKSMGQISLVDDQKIIILFQKYFKCRFQIKAKN